MKPRPLNRLGVLIFVLVFTFALGAMARPNPKTAGTTASSPAPVTTNGTIRKATGSPNAPITMEIFGDFQCPACRAFFETTVKQVMDEYVIPGKVYVVFHDFPLEMHPYARQAARLANAAAELDKFDAIERALYDHQDEWATKGNIEQVIAPLFPPVEFKKIQAYEAQHLSEINASIDRDVSLGQQRNVNQTPSVFITAHGKTEALPGGTVDYKLLKQYFDYLLRQ